MMGGNIERKLRGNQPPFNADMHGEQIRSRGQIEWAVASQKSAGRS